MGATTRQVTRGASGAASKADAPEQVKPTCEEATATEDADQGLVSSTEPARRAGGI